ncbi:MAG: cytochrome c, partial [Gammaproteobacteria bacterium]|nr:cytochrome c [Gammaproteobacteria bacterium]
MATKLALLALLSSLSSLALGWDGADKGGEIAEAMRLPPNLEEGEKLYQTCAHCHTKSGWGMAPGIGTYRSTSTYPQIAGQHQSVLIKQILDIRNLNRDNPTMYPFSTERYLGGSQEIADVTAYITALPINSNSQHGTGRDLELGKSLFEKNCAKCHGENGEGDAENFYPRLAQQ